MLQQCFPDKVKRSQAPGVFQRERAILKNNFHVKLLTMQKPTV